MTSSVWTFAQQKGKLVVAEELALTGNVVNSAIAEVVVQGHTLRTYQGVAQRCMAPCGTLGLLRGDTCDLIQAHNAEDK